jgi:hypothetical protein
MFSITDGILLRPLPFPKSDRLVNVWETAAACNIPRMVAALRQVSEIPTLRPQSCAGVARFACLDFGNTRLSDDLAERHTRPVRCLRAVLEAPI